MQPISILQNFTRVNNDRTGLNPFPIGLEVNPRTNVLVLNGREGHLQFFSPHTRSLLFNVCIKIFFLLLFYFVLNSLHTFLFSTH